MPLVTFDIDVQVWCSKCGQGICHLTDAEDRMGVHVQPCDHCMDENFDEGYAQGLEEIRKEYEELDQRASELEEELAAARSE